MLNFEDALSQDIEAARVYENKGPQGPEFSSIIIKATEIYETVLSKGDGLPYAFINLAHIYWQSLGTGLAVYVCFPMKFREFAGQRYLQLMEESEARFPNIIDVAFWKKYFDAISLGLAPFEAECEKIMENPTSSHDPYFYLFTMNSGKKYQKEAELLKNICLNVPTFKNRYILSILESVENARSQGPFTV